MDTSIIWNNFLIKIKDKVDVVAYDTWFKDTKLFELNNGIAKIIVPLSVHKKQLRDKLGDLIEDTFNEITGTNFKIEYLLEDELNQNKIEKEKGVPSINYSNTNLNNSLVFENYIVGDSNKFAQATSLAVAENPGKMYNPLFIYGNSGLGKTHLMHAIGNYIIKNSNKKVLYVTSEQFMTDFIEINKKDDTGTNYNYVDIFKNKYRSIDVLIIDDIQFLRGNGTQQEFFHTFNKLYDNEKQIIISSDKSPDDLRKLEDRLKTRFKWGLTVNIFPPDLDLRIAILKNKIEGQDLLKNIPDDVIYYISNNCESDVRQLEGAITRLYAYSAIMNSDNITLNLAIEALKDYLNSKTISDNNVKNIQNVVADYYNLDLETLNSKNRSTNILLPRQIAMYLIRELTDESYPKIGIYFGGRDHTTVMHACDKIKKQLEVNQELINVVNNIKNLL